MSTSTGARGAGTDPGRRAASGDADLGEIARLLRPLASPVRLGLLRFLARPRYLEEIASHLGVSRQAARKHLEQLAAIGAVERRPGTREGRAVTEYTVNQQAIYLVYDEFEKLGSLGNAEREQPLSRTLQRGGPIAPGSAGQGPCLFVMRGFDTGRRIPLARRPGAEWIIGRDERCSMVVKYDPFLSNRHAEVLYEGGRFILADLKSTNGTSHNWAPLGRGGRANLRHGDVVGVGKALLLFWDDALPGPASGRQRES